MKSKDAIITGLVVLGFWWFSTHRKWVPSKDGKTETLQSLGIL